MTQRHELERGLHRLRTDVVLGARARTRLFDGLAGENAEGDRDGERGRELGQRSRDGVREHVEMGGLASDQAAKGDDRIESSRSREQPDRRGQLERPRDLELLHLRLRCERGLDGALGQPASDLSVPTRAHDRHARAATGILNPGRSLPTGRHLPQSSPRMQSCSVSA
jgi:hypothetical protein